MLHLLQQLYFGIAAVVCKRLTMFLDVDMVGGHNYCQNLNLVVEVVEVACIEAYSRTHLVVEVVQQVHLDDSTCCSCCTQEPPLVDFYFFFFSKAKTPTTLKRLELKLTRIAICVYHSG